MNYKFISKAVWLEKEKMLIIGDLHIGYEEMLNIAMPRSQYKTIIEDLKEIFKQTGKIQEIIVLGDLKHEFSENLEQEWKDIKNFLEFLMKNCEKIVLIKGNHDNYLASIASRYNIEVLEYYIKDDKAFFHGDKKIKQVENKKVNYWFLGHFHPSISIRENVKRESYKCFLKGKFKNTENCKFSVSQTPLKNKQGVCDKEVIILPSFFPLIEGNDVLSFESNLAYDFDLKNFEVFIPSDKEASESLDSEGHQKSERTERISEILDFGKVRDVGKLN